MQKTMEEPVILADGHSYERWGAEEWLKCCGKSAVLGTPLQHKRVTPNHALTRVMQDIMSGKLVL